MTVEILYLVVGAMLIVKAAVALVMPSRFYRWRRGQYLSSTPPPIVLVVPTVVAILATASWAIVAREGGFRAWALAIMLSLVVAAAVRTLLRWRTVAPRLATAAQTAPLRVVDAALLAAGLVLVFVGVLK
jgi:hypothetical protein